ncbi:hypothetical protein SAMN05216188_104243 [Lentzea xinjiangensis]|uniref:Uncharacterized protein n=1 Tax=Lentzea xinjiangensis TaxID=402600 RepID=A0A1H9HXG5_9PSEU|nr:hypothetical protein SAMN05216188_104243 [Lentzea xinjiangensis]
MLAGALLALLGVIFGFAVIYLCRICHAWLGCTSCDRFVHLRFLLDSPLKAARRFREGVHVQSGRTVEGE